jgi:uncharacterized protein YbjT (DUF2867 family)
LFLILPEVWCQIGVRSIRRKGALLRRFVYDKRKPRRMSATAKTAVLLGASGLVGGYCLQTLLAGTGYARVVLLIRRELAAARHPRLTQKVVDFDALTQTDFAGADDVFCALGTTMRKAGSQQAFRRVDIDYPLTAARLSRQAGARQFLLVSSVGANAAAKNFYLRTKGEVEEEIDKLGFNAVHIFRPSLLLGKREEFRLGERITIAVAPLLNFALVGGMRRYRAISAASVGKAMVAAAEQDKSGTSLYEYEEIRRLAASI